MRVIAPQRSEVEAYLATLGVDRSGEHALDATLTAESFARDAPAPKSEPSVGPLPRIALSGGAHRGQPDASGSADLEILRVLGEGGMGRVHLARQRSLGREVAIKMLKDDVADVAAAEMLRTEATIMGRLEHPNVVPVHAVGLDDAGRLLLVMKRIDGAPWRDLMRDPDHPRWKLFAADASERLDAQIGVLVQVANALELAHQHGVIHRDVKPDNVLLGTHGDVYLADWGVALRMEDRAGRDLVGTPAYMAPEMVIGDRSKIDARTDVFLLGATLHEILTGVPPYLAPTLHASLLAAYDGEPMRYAASVPAELAVVATRAMARDPEVRYATALDFRRALDELRAHRGSIALARSGQDALKSLEQTLADPAASREGIDRTLTECRFALASALREWPGNEDAARALASCLRLAIRHELTRDNPEAARALLAELAAPDLDLAAEVDTALARSAAQKGELERLRSLDADGDLWVGARSRLAMFAMFAVLTVVLLVFLGSRNYGHSGTSPWAIVRVAGFVSAAVLVLVVVFRRSVLANAVGRRITSLIVIGQLAVLVHRVIAAVHDVPPEVTMTMDLVVFAAVGAGSGTLIRGASWCAAPPLLAIVFDLLYPASSPILYGVSLLGMIGVASLVLVRELRRRAREREMVPTAPSRDR